MPARAAAPAGSGLGILGLDLGEGAAFESAEAALAKGRLGPGLEAEAPGERRRRLLRAPLQVAAVERRELHSGAREAARGGFGLAQAGVAQRDVDVALQPAFGIPGGFAMPDQADAA